MTKDEMIAQLQEEVKGLSRYLATEDYGNACDDAARDTGWGFPVSEDFKILWQKQRSKRFLFFYLLTESAYYFKTGQENIQQQFDHYKDVIKLMDDEYQRIMEERPEMFGDVSAFHVFGTKIDAGYAYNPQTGKDLTYDSDQVVMHHPDEED